MPLPYFGNPKPGGFDLDAAIQMATLTGTYFVSELPKLLPVLKVHQESD